VSRKEGNLQTDNTGAMDHSGDGGVPHMWICNKVVKAGGSWGASHAHVRNQGVPALIPIQPTALTTTI